MQGFSDCRIAAFQLGGDAFVPESCRVKMLNPSDTELSGALRKGGLQYSRRFGIDATKFSTPVYSWKNTEMTGRSRQDFRKGTRLLRRLLSVLYQI
jgi:hypothetical protein